MTIMSTRCCFETQLFQKLKLDVVDNGKNIFQTLQNSSTISKFLHLLKKGISIHEQRNIMSKRLAKSKENKRELKKRLSKLRERIPKMCDTEWESSPLRSSPLLLHSQTLGNPPIPSQVQFFFFQLWWLVIIPYTNVQSQSWLVIVPPYPFPCPRPGYDDWSSSPTPMSSPNHDWSSFPLTPSPVPDPVMMTGHHPLHQCPVPIMTGHRSPLPLPLSQTRLWWLVIIPYTNVQSQSWLVIVPPYPFPCPRPGYDDWSSSPTPMSSPNHDWSSFPLTTPSPVQSWLVIIPPYPFPCPRPGYDDWSSSPTPMSSPNHDWSSFPLTPSPVPDPVMMTGHHPLHQCPVLNHDWSSFPLTPSPVPDPVMMTGHHPLHQCPVPIMTGHRSPLPLPLSQTRTHMHRWSGRPMSTHHRAKLNVHPNKEPCFWNN